jgi:hypothetical protein
MSALSVKPGDRNELLKLAIQGVRASAVKERSHFDDPENVAQF